MRLSHRRGPSLVAAGEFESRPWDEYTQGYAIHRELIRDAGLAQGLEFERLSRRTYVLRGKHREVRFLRRMSDRTSVVAREITNDKELTRLHLRRAAVRCPEGRRFRSDSAAAAWDFAVRLATSVVVKPVRGSGGRGITTDIGDRNVFERAWKLAGRGSIIVEEFVEGDEYRLFVLEDRVVAASLRTAAHVVGDGRSTVSQLVQGKNETRRPNPYVGSKEIQLSPDVLALLAAADLTPEATPEAGRRVQLKTVSNVGAGGDSEDWTDIVHPGFVAAAVRAKEAIPGLYHAGVDLITPDISADPAHQRWAVCEVNSNPDIALHHFPVAGRPRDVAAAFVGALFRPDRCFWH